MVLAKRALRMKLGWSLCNLRLASCDGLLQMSSEWRPHRYRETLLILPPPGMCVHLVAT